MNFVIVSIHFFPQADAESFCTTRFASALAHAGHHVQVVTIEAPKVVSDEVCAALLDPRVKIVRVPVPNPQDHRLSFNFSRLRYFTYEQEAGAISACIVATKRVLKSVENPVLVSRTHPLASTIIGWHCHKYAEKWIAHLSDPLPWFSWDTMFGRLRYHFERLWMRRTFRDASAISVTCSQVCRYFHDSFGPLFDRQTAFVTTHIGDNKLKMRRQPWTGKVTGKIIAHPGTFFARRGVEAVAEAVATLNREGVACTLVVVGGGPLKQTAELAKRPHVHVLTDFNPALSLSLTDTADVLYVADFESSFPYSPRLMSKFVYQVFEDKPMVVRAPRISAQHDYCERFPDSGMFYADDSDPRSLVEALRRAMACAPDSFDRTAIRKEFSEETIANAFVENVNKLR